MQIHHELLNNACLQCLYSEVSSPYGAETLVFKVANKMFAILSLQNTMLSLKCDPELAIELRERYECVHPGYHLNKTHWNSIYWEQESLPLDQFLQWIEDSYNLVLASFSKKDRAALAQGTNE